MRGVRANRVAPGDMAQTTETTVNVRLGDGWAHVSLGGKIDGATARAVADMIEAVLSGREGATLDLTDLRQVDGKGRDVLASLASDLRAADLDVYLDMPAAAAPREAVESSGLSDAAKGEHPGAGSRGGELGQHQQSAERQLSPDVGEQEAEEAAGYEERLRGRTERTVAAGEAEPDREHRPHTRPD